MSKYDEGFDAGYDKAQYKARNDALEEAAKLVRESCLPDAYSMSALEEIADEILAMKECGK